MNLLFEELKVPHAARDLERALQYDDRLATARAARCRSCGCHPIVERMSQLLVTAGARLNVWAAPSYCQLRVEVRRTSIPTSTA